MILIQSTILSGCKQETKNVCVVCGNEATHTLSGPAEYVEEAGVDLSKCKKITDNIYSASLCDSCNKLPTAHDPANK